MGAKHGSGFYDQMYNPYGRRNLYGGYGMNNYMNQGYGGMNPMMGMEPQYNNYSSPYGAMLY